MLTYSAPHDGVKRLLRWAILFAGVLVLGLYAKPFEPPVVPGAGRVYPRIPDPPSLDVLLSMLGVGSVVWYAVFIALPFLLWMARHAERGSKSRGSIVGALVGALLLLIALSSLAQWELVYHDAPSRPAFLHYLPEALRQNLLPWIALGAIVVGVESRRRAVALATDRERLRTEIAEQRLVALTAQLQPHFLFNTLQGISTLIHRDPDAADEMLSKLADLLRDVLRDRDRVLVPLRDEARYARTYLEIAKLRFGDRLSYEIDIPSLVDQAQVPLFVLQPLIENGLNHGIGSRIRGGSLRLVASEKNGRLLIEVIDDGEGLRAATMDGIGLSNTRERLKASFGDDARFALAPAEGGGTVARLDLPIVRST